MILLVASACNRPGANERVGDFVSPRSFNLVGKTKVWAADNDAFNGFNPDRFRRMLDAITTAPHKPKFVTMPDVVGDHRRTVELSLQWTKEFHDRGIPRAFVLQNGIEHLPPEFAVSWNNNDAFFIGGDTAFKFSEWVHWFVQFSKRAAPHKWIHMGRVNSVKRLDYARRIGCDSCDGSGMARFSRRVLNPMLNSLNQLHLF